MSVSTKPAIIAASLALIQTTGDTALAQGLFDSTPSYMRAPDLTMMRFGIIASSAAIGFGLGWFFSPEAKKLRLIVAGVIFVLLFGTAVLDNGALGWSLTPFVAVIGFAAGFGYWAARVVHFLGDPPTTFGSAIWATLQHLREHGAIGDNGICLGWFPGAKLLSRLCYTGIRHLLTVAPSQTGKGATAIINNLLTYLGSVLVIDPKGENAMITAERRKAMGQEVMVLDPCGVTADSGLDVARFNPMDWLETADPELAEKCMILSDALHIMSEGANRFFEEESKSAVAGLIGYVATDPDESGQRHLGRVRDLLLLDSAEQKTLFQKMTGSPHQFISSTGARFLQKEAKLLSNVMASAQAQTHMLDSPQLRESLSASDFRFEDLKTKRMSVYIVVPSDRLNTFSRWMRLLVQQAITVNARNIHIKPEKPVLFVLDELPVLGRLTMVEQAFGLMAGYGMQLWGITQDLSQLKGIYGDSWETFISNAGAIQYFGSRDVFTAEYFSKLCGVTTVWNWNTAVARAFGSASGSGGPTSNSSTTVTDTRTATKRQLAHPDELMRMHKSRSLVFIENLNPILGTKVPWFEDPALKDLGRNLRNPEQGSQKPQEPQKITFTPQDQDLDDV